MDSQYFDNIDLNRDNSLTHLLDDITDLEIDEATILNNSLYYDYGTLML